MDGLGLHACSGAHGRQALSASVLEQAAEETRGMSCRELEKLVVSLHGDFLSQEGAEAGDVKAWWEQALAERCAELQRRKIETIAAGEEEDTDIAVSEASETVKSRRGEADESDNK